MPVVIGIGGNCTAEVVDHIRHFDFTGIDAVLSVAPYYNKPSQEGIYQHYKAIAGVSPRPVVMYNIPGRTGVNMTAETTLRLARECKNIIAVKEASGNLSQMAYILRDRPEGFLVISADEQIEKLKAGAFLDELLVSEKGAKFFAEVDKSKGNKATLWGNE